MEPFIGQIMMFGGTFAPRNWAFCNGQLISISQNQSLFAIIGTAYGGDGRTNFALPDLRGRGPIHEGNGPGLDPIRLGQKGGLERVTLNETQMPLHKHSATTEACDPIPRGSVTNPDPNGKYWAQGGVYSAQKNATMAEDAVGIGSAGESQAHENRPPYLAVNFIIALQGIFPSRS